MPETDTPRPRGRPPKAIDGGLGWRIRHFRREAGLTLRQVAERSGLPLATLCDLEHRTDPDWLAQLERVAAAIEVPLPLLLITLADEPREVRAAKKAERARKRKEKSQCDTP